MGTCQLICFLSSKYVLALKTKVWTNFEMMNDDRNKICNLLKCKKTWLKSYEFITKTFENSLPSSLLRKYSCKILNHLTQEVASMGENMYFKDC